MVSHTWSRMRAMICPTRKAHAWRQSDPHVDTSHSPLSTLHIKRRKAVDLGPEHAVPACACRERADFVRPALRARLQAASLA